MARPLPHVAQIRLSPVQYRFLVVEAHRRGARGLGALVRELIDAAIDAQVVDLDPASGATGRLPLRDILEQADTDALEELADMLPAARYQAEAVPISSPAESEQK